VKNPRKSRSNKRTQNLSEKPTVFEDLDIGQKIIAAHIGRAGELETAVADLIAGFLELARRLPKGPIPLALSLYSSAIQQEKETDLPKRIESLGKDFAVVISSVEPTALPDLLRKVAVVIAGRPLKPFGAPSGPISLTAADPNRAAVFRLLEKVVPKIMPTSGGVISNEKILAEIVRMAPEERQNLLRDYGACPTSDDQTLTRALRSVFKELKLPRGSRIKAAN
jgi:hypothetical protein